MKVLVRDREAFATLSHLDLRAYLHARGWREEGRLGDKALILVRDAHGESFEILLPLREDIGDYLARMAEAVHVLAEVEQRAETSILADLSVAGSDVIRVRAMEASHDGTIPLLGGVALYTEARELLLAAACAAQSPRPVFHSRKPQMALDYMNNVRMGQSERGSYVATLLSPVDPALRSVSGGQLPLLPEFEEEPYERLVTLTLVRALRAAREAVTEAIATDGFEAFESRVENGISSNLCEALAGLIETVGAVDIGLTWAKVRPLHGEETSAPIRIDFTRTAGKVLHEAARQFRSREPLLEQALIGWVTRLGRGPDDEMGGAALSLLVDGKPKTAKVTGLGHADYQKLSIANVERKAVSCEGDLYRIGRGYELRNVRNITLLSVEDPE